MRTSSSPVTASAMALSIIGPNWWTSLASLLTPEARMTWSAVTTAWAL
ncbi:hypothetical protein ACFQ4K_21195 [Tistrella bauzanensis]